jgi:hypothetical protein
MHATTQSPEPQRVELAQAFVEWEKGFEEQIKEKFDLALPSRAIFHPCLSTGKQTVKAVLLWSEKHSESASDLWSKLNYVSEFTIELYDALAPQDQSAARQRGFWAHVDLNYICLRATKFYREQFLDRHPSRALRRRTSRARGCIIHS